MSDDILDQIDSALADATSCFCGCTQEIKAKSPLPWFASEDCQARWNARQSASKSSTGERPPRGGLAACRGCRRVALVLPDAKLCGPCSALPSCGAERSNERTGRRMVCFRPAGHEAVHEDFDTGSQWVGEESQVEPLRRERVAELFGVPVELLAAAPAGVMTEEQFDRYVETGIESDAPPVDASSDTTPDVPRKSKLSELAAALRARARRGGTK